MAVTEQVVVPATNDTDDRMSHFYCGAHDRAICGHLGTQPGQAAEAVDCVVCMEMDRSVGRLTCPRTGGPCSCLVVG